MGMQADTTEGFNSEINVTPMADVMLVLLIIFMVITPLLQQGVTVTLPRGKSAVEDANIIKDTAVVVAIPSEGMYYVGRDLVQGKDNLINTIKTRVDLLKPGEQIVYIKGGLNVNYGEVVNVVDSIREAGYDRIGLVVEKKKDNEE